MSIFIATGLTKTRSHRDKTELIRQVKFFDFEDIHRQVLKGKIKNAFTALGILLAKQKIGSK